MEWNVSHGIGDEILRKQFLWWGCLFLQERHCDAGMITRGGSDTASWTSATQVSIASGERQKPGLEGIWALKVLKLGYFLEGGRDGRICLGGLCSGTTLMAPIISLRTWVDSPLVGLLSQPQCGYLL